MSDLPPLQGHDEVRAALARAARDDELPGSLLVHGPPGIGKQRLGLWLAQLLLCTGAAQDGSALRGRGGENGDAASSGGRTAAGEPGADGPAAPCDACHACRLARRLEHPDLHWFFPLPRPRRVSGPDRLADALEDARAAELAARRADPYRPVAPGEPVGLFLAQMQTLRRFAGSRPAMGRRKVFIVGDAEALVPQESSPEAANALLKVLEEPPAETTFILTASDPDALLPTMRSRLLPVRLRALAEADVVRFLVEARGVEEELATVAARLAQGAIGRALAFLPVDDDEPGPLEALRRQARTLLEAAAADSSLPRYAASHGFAPSGARGAFSDILDFLALWIRDLAATAEGAGDLVVNVDARALLTDLARRLPAAAAGAPDALRAIDEARTLAYGNVNPQLTAAWLLRALGHSLRGEPAAIV